MKTSEKTVLQVSAEVNAPMTKIWDCWTNPKHITQWNQASEDWHSPYSENDLRVGGSFKTTMAAKDKSMQFDFGGKYTTINEHKLIEYTLEDDRKVKIEFITSGNSTQIIESFEAENMNPLEMQQGGWQAIMNSFKNYVESNN